MSRRVSAGARATLGNFGTRGSPRVFNCLCSDHIKIRFAAHAQAPPTVARARFHVVLETILFFSFSRCALVAGQQFYVVLQALRG